MAKNRTKRAGSYVLEIMIGQDSLSESFIKEQLERKIIKDWAYIVHDKDTVDLKDDTEVKEEAFRRLINDEKSEIVKDVWTDESRQEVRAEVLSDYMAKVKADPRKWAHWHIVLFLPDNFTYADEAAKWFGIPQNFVRIKKTGRGGRKRNTLLDCVKYLTHEDEKQQELGKFRYPDEEVKSSFEWRDELTKRTAEKQRYGKDLTDRESLQLKVLFEGMTLKQARELDPLNYNKDLQVLKRNRGDFLANQKPPQGRITFYIYGKGGTGKDLLARAIARGLYRQYEEDDEIFFELGAKGAEFEGYDGQPVMLWSDVRAPELLSRWGRGNLLNILDPYPKANKKQNVKYSSLGLLNEVNILTGPDDYQVFLSNLMGGYEDKHGNKYEAENIEQITRRVPIIIPIRQDDFDILINSGVANGTSDFGQYYHHKRVQGSLYRAHQILSNAEKLQEVEGKIALPVIDVARSIKPVKEIGGLLELDEFESYGEEKEVSDFEREIMAMTSDDLKWLVNDLMSELQKIQRDDDFFMYEENEKRKQEIHEKLRMIRALNRDISD